jgi:anti-anti-sigma factor
MKTNIKKAGDTIVVSMDGRLDFETNAPLREELSKLVRPNRTDSVPKKIIFDLENLEFVGSSGISSFVQTLKDFNASVAEKPKYCNVRSEFRRVMNAFDNEGETFEFHDNQERARKSFDQ